jgi:hypothetical protein
VTRGAIAAALVALIPSTGACDCRKETPPAAPAAGSSAAPPAKLAPAKPPAGSAAAPDRPAGVTARMVTLTLDDATAALPAIEGVTALEKTRLAPEGQQAHAAWCIAAPDQAAAHDRLEEGLVAAGWEVAAGGRAAAARVAVVATRPPYRLQASISASPRPGCSPADDHWFASLALFKLE